MVRHLSFGPPQRPGFPLSQPPGTETSGNTLTTFDGLINNPWTDTSAATGGLEYCTGELGIMDCMTRLGPMACGFEVYSDLDAWDTSTVYGGADAHARSPLLAPLRPHVDPPSPLSQPPRPHVFRQPVGSYAAQATTTVRSTARSSAAATLSPAMAGA